VTVVAGGATSAAKAVEQLQRRQQQRGPISSEPGLMLS